MKAQILFIVFFSFSSLFYFGNFEKSKTISGKVTDNFGEPIAYASISVKNNSKYNTVTDKEGNYSINVPNDSKTLIFSAIGCESKEVEITKEEIDVVLSYKRVEMDDIELDSDMPIIHDESGEVEMSKPTKSRSYDGLFAKRMFSDKVAATAPAVSYEDSYTRTDVTVVTGEKKEKKSLFERDFGSKGIKKKDKPDKKESGQLTAGEINDFSKWTLWQDIAENDLKMYKDMWGFYPLERYGVMITDHEKKPIINCKVQLQTKKGEVIWSARTDNTGKAELWANMFDSTATKKSKYVISIDYHGQIFSIRKPTKFHDGINKFVIQANCNIPDAVDVAFVVDATGSMGDEILYLQAEIEDVIKRTQKNHKKLDINLASVFYRDHNEEYLTRKSDFNGNIKKAVKFINEQEAQAGGDFPEAVEDGLEVAVNELEWRDEARTRVLFLVLDAPPHNEQATVERLQKISQIASEKGIRIVPITCSGIDKSTEYLMRSLALATNGTYVFLTDDSGIGGSHIKPTTDSYDVELLNDLMVRLLDQYVTTPDCKNRISYNDDQMTDTMIVVNDNPLDTTLVSKTDSLKNDVEPYDYSEGIKYYPNPTTGPVNIEIQGDVKELYIADYSGKILERREIFDEQKVVLDITQYPAGMYFIKFLNKDRWMTGKIVLVH